MNEDDPTDVAHELFIEALWAGIACRWHRRSSERRTSIIGMSRDIIHGYWESPLLAALGGRGDRREPA